MMKESRQRQLLEGQSSVARKVFEGVPIQEYWAEDEILRHLKLTSTGASPHTVRACLGELKDAGLIREPLKNHFQRAIVNIKPPKPEASEAVMNNGTQKSGQPKAEITPMDQLATVGTELTLLATEFGERLRAMALRIEEVALSVESQRESDAAAMAKVRQFQGLLKSIGGE